MIVVLQGALEGHASDVGGRSSRVLPRLVGPQAAAAAADPENLWRSRSQYEASLRFRDGQTSALGRDGQMQVM